MTGAAVAGRASSRRRRQPDLGDVQPAVVPRREGDLQPVRLLAGALAESFDQGPGVDKEAFAGLMPAPDCRWGRGPRRTRWSCRYRRRGAAPCAPPLDAEAARVLIPGPGRAGGARG